MDSPNNGKSTEGSESTVGQSWLTLDKQLRSMTVKLLSWTTLTFLGHSGPCRTNSKQQRLTCYLKIYNRKIFDEDQSSFPANADVVYLLGLRVKVLSDWIIRSRILQLCISISFS